jgi:hypothetical protein
MALPMLAYGSNIWNINAKNETKNGNCRSEISEECSGLHTERPDKKYQN